MPQDPFAAIAQPMQTADPFAAIAHPTAQPVNGAGVDESGIPALTSQGVAAKYALTQAGKGVADVVKGTLQTFDPRKQPGENAFTQIPLVRMVRGAVEPLTHVGEIPGAIRDIANSPSALHALATSAPRAGGQAAAVLASSAAAKGLSKVGELRRALAPKEVPIAGEKVPVLKGEANPESLAGHAQATAKQTGAGAQAFKDFATKQQAAVKQVIRNVAQQTSGAVGPMPEEAGAAMSNAADATFAKARPMYEALDSALVTVPDALDNVAKVTEQAMTRARKLGAQINESGGDSVTIDGRKYTPQSDPQAWANLKAQGLVPDTAGQPLSTYMKIRSELLKMQRASTDAATRTAIANEVQTMNANMETALKGTPLFDDWNEANRLWSKGYAIRDVADALRKSTKGTPAAEQAPGLSQVPTRIVGSQLVKRLNELKQNGILDRAFTQQEASNLRQAADILDRASGKPGMEFRIGYSPHSTIWREIVKLPFYPLVKAMTTTEGVQAIQSGNVAALTAVVTGTGQVRNRKDAMDLLRP